MKHLRKTHPLINFQDVFEAMPGRYLLLDVDLPKVSILDASESYLRLGWKTREELVGLSLFEQFPEKNFSTRSMSHAAAREALARVIREGLPVALGTFRYDVPDPNAGENTFERYWSPVFIPVFDAGKEVRAIMMRLEEVTDYVLRERYRPTHYGNTRQKGGEAQTILIIEADEELRAYWAADFGIFWSVEVVGSAKEAFEMIATHQPDLIFTAMKLPDQSGRALITALKEAVLAPVVVRVEQSEARLYREAFEAGADDVIGGMASTREIMARLQTQLAEAAWQEATRERIHRQYHQLFMQAPVAITLVDGPDQTVIMSNLENERIAKRPITIGRTMAELFPEEEFQPLFANMRRVYESGVPYFGKEVSVNLSFNDRARYVTYALLPLRDLRGEVQGVASFGYDVTEQVETRQVLERDSERKDELLAMLGHELRNPLAPVLHANDLLKLNIDTPDPLQITEATETIERQVSQLRRHVDDLLDIARVNKGHIPIKPTDTDLEQIITGAIETCRDAIHRKEQHLELSVPAEPVRVHLDGPRMIQVLANLLDNASRHSAPGGRIWLEVSQERDEEQSWLSISLRDEGEGIDAEFMPELFDLFTQGRATPGRATPGRAHGGLGLGLALVRRIVAEHGGTVRAYSAGPGLGSQFFIKLPLAALPEIQVMPPVPEEELDGMRVLVVDDLPGLASALARLLRKKGAQTVIATSGSEALEMAAMTRFTHIFLDIGLPDMDGYEVARRLRESVEGPSYRLIALTGYGQPEDVIRARQVGFDRHLVKPASLEQLVEALQNF